MGGVSIVKNKFFHSSYHQLNELDKKMLAEYNQLYKTIKKDLWRDFKLADQTILAVSKDSLNTYMINPKSIPNNVFSKKIDMPASFALQSVYRIVSIAPRVVKIRLDMASNFCTINKTYHLLGNGISSVIM